MSHLSLTKYIPTNIYMGSSADLGSNGLMCVRLCCIVIVDRVYMNESGNKLGIF